VSGPGTVSAVGSAQRTDQPGSRSVRGTQRGRTARAQATALASASTEPCRSRAVGEVAHLTRPRKPAMTLGVDVPRPLDDSMLAVAAPLAGSKNTGPSTWMSSCPGACRLGSVAISCSRVSSSERVSTAGAIAEQRTLRRAGKRETGRAARSVPRADQGTIQRVCQGRRTLDCGAHRLPKRFAGGSLREVPASGRYSIANAASSESPSTNAHPAFSGCETMSQSPSSHRPRPASLSSPIPTTAPYPTRSRSVDHGPGCTEQLRRATQWAEPTPNTRQSSVERESIAAGQRHDRTVYTDRFLNRVSQVRILPRAPV
jgi:hypothetical protein